jgi:hypothetical protein
MALDITVPRVYLLGLCAVCVRPNAASLKFWQASRPKVYLLAPGERPLARDQHDVGNVRGVGRALELHVLARRSCGVHEVEHVTGSPRTFGVDPATDILRRGGDPGHEVACAVFLGLLAFLERFPQGPPGRCTFLTPPTFPLRRGILRVGAAFVLRRDALQYGIFHAPAGRPRCVPSGRDQIAPHRHCGETANDTTASTNAEIANAA